MYEKLNYLHLVTMGLIMHNAVASGLESRNVSLIPIRYLDSIIPLLPISELPVASIQWCKVPGGHDGRDEVFQRRDGC
jgi:hypothetical protein